MGARVVDGRGLAAELKGRLEVEVADFMEAGVVPGLIKKEHVREGVIAIDVGISSRRDLRTGKEGFVGDLDFAGVAAVAEALSPVPGGSARSPTFGSSRTPPTLPGSPPAPKKHGARWSRRTRGRTG